MSRTLHVMHLLWSGHWFGHLRGWSLGGNIYDVRTDLVFFEGVAGD